MSAATVSIALDEYTALRDKAITLEREVAVLRANADAARLGDDEAVLALHEFALDAMVVVGFAVANLDPLTVRGWPYAALHRYALALPTIPGIPDGIRETSMDLRMFADNAESWEKTRALGKEQERLAEENAARSTGGTLALIAEQATAREGY